MAGTVTTTEQTHTLIKKVTFAWVSSAAGAADATTTLPYDGIVLEARFLPGTAGSQPTDQYDVTVKDAAGFDLLQGFGANLTNASNVTTCASTLNNGLGLGCIANSTLTLAVTNAGDTKAGSVVVFIQ